MASNLAKLENKLNKLGGKAQLLKNQRLTTQIKFKVKIARDDTKKLRAIIKKYPAVADRAIAHAMKTMAPELKKALDDAMDANVWKWQTEVSNDTRDIIDTGALKDSGRVFYKENQIQIRYGEVYAMIVHYGGYVGSGYQPGLKIYYPPRPWIDAVVNGDGPVERYPFEARFLELFLQYVYSKQPELRS